MSKELVGKKRLRFNDRPHRCFDIITEEHVIKSYRIFAKNEAQAKAVVSRGQIKGSELRILYYSVESCEEVTKDDN